MTVPVKSVWAEFVTKFDLKPLKKAEKQTKKLSASLKKAGAALIAAFSVKVTLDLTKVTLKQADALAKLAARSGATVEELQELNFVFGQLGDQVDAGKTLFEMDKALGSMDAKTANKELRKLGLTLKDLDGKSNFEKFQLITDGLRGMEDAQKRNALASKFFAGEAEKMENSIRASSDAIQTAQKEFNIAGPAISSSFAAGAEGINDQISVAGNAVANLKVDFVTALLGDSPEKAKEIAEAVSKILLTVADNMDLIFDLAKVLVSVFVGFKVLSGVVGVVGLLVKSFGILAAIAATIKTLFVGIAFVTGLGLAPILLIIAGVAALVAGVVLLYQNWDFVVGKVKEFWGWIKKIASGPLDAIAALFSLGGTPASSGADLGAWVAGTNAPAAAALGSSHSVATNVRDNSTTVLNVNGAGRDPSQIASAVRRELDAQRRRTSGAAAGRR